MYSTVAPVKCCKGAPVTRCHADNYTVVPFFLPSRTLPCTVHLILYMYPPLRDLQCLFEVSAFPLSFHVYYVYSTIVLMTELCLRRALEAELDAVLLSLLFFHSADISRALRISSLSPKSDHFYPSHFLTLRHCGWSLDSRTVVSPSVPSPVLP